MNSTDFKAPMGIHCGAPLRLTLHGPHSVLRKVSKALRVRINPFIDEHGPYVVIEKVTPEEVMIIAQILDG